jgi:hypothetical protein
MTERALETTSITECEAELEAARAEGVIRSFVIWSPTENDDGWCYVLATGPAPAAAYRFPAGDRITAARAAVEYVRSLRPAEPVLPDVGGMGMEQCAAELIAGGWQLSIHKGVAPVWVLGDENDDLVAELPLGNRLPVNWYRNAVLRKRELAAAEKKAEPEPEPPARLDEETLDELLARADQCELEPWNMRTDPVSWTTAVRLLCAEVRYCRAVQSAPDLPPIEMMADAEVRAELHIRNLRNDLRNARYRDGRAARGE